MQTATYDLTGYDKVTVMVYSEPYQSNNTMTVATNAQTKTVNLSGNSFSWYTFVLDCNTSDRVRITTSGMPDMRYVKIYAGDPTAANQLKASETGDATYRVITGITSKSYTVTGLTEAGTFNFYVVANYINGGVADSEIKQVTLLENSDPTIVVNPAALDLTTNIGEPTTATFHVSGSNLTGDVNLALNDENGVYSIEPMTITAADALNGVDVTVTYTPTVLGTDNAMITLTSAGAEDVTVALNGTANLAKYTPVMLPANEQFINLTKFRADWTDATPEANVESYTLEVTLKPETPVILDPVLLEDADFTSLTSVTNSSNQLTNVASSASDYLPDGWTAQTGLWINNGYIISGYLSSNACGVTSKTYDFTGYDKVTVVMSAYSYYASYYGAATIRVKTSAGSQEVVLGTDNFNTYTVVLDVAENDQVVFEGVENLFAIQDIKIYAGDTNATYTMLLAQETGDENSRLITGITDKFYTVENLAAGGTFLYRVKALYIDGTESNWSNIEEVTLFQNGHGFDLGDVNHDGSVTIKDVTALIDYLLGNGEVCMICADVNGDSVVTIKDVTDLIDMLLGNTANRKLARPERLIAW